MYMQKKSSRKTRSEGMPLALSALLGALTALTSGIALLLLFALILHKTNDPSRFSNAASLASLCVGCLIGGALVCAKARASSRYLSVGAAALTVSLISLGFCLATSGGVGKLLPLLLRHAGILAAFYAGAFVAKPRRRRSKRTKR